MSKIPFLGRSSKALMKPLGRKKENAFQSRPPKKTLPLVERMRSDIDALFIRYVGPIGGAISEDTYQRWLQAGKVGPLGLRKYIVMLSREIPNANQQADFVEKAIRFLKP